MNVCVVFASTGDLDVSLVGEKKKKKETLACGPNPMNHHFEHTDGPANKQGPAEVKHHIPVHFMFSTHISNRVCVGVCVCVEYVQICLVANFVSEFVKLCLVLLSLINCELCL